MIVIKSPIKAFYLCWHEHGEISVFLTLDTKSSPYGNSPLSPRKQPETPEPRALTAASAVASASGCGGGGEGGGGRLREAPPRSSILSFNKEIPTLGTRPVPFLVELSVLGTALLVSRNQPLAGASSEGRRQGSSAGFETPKLGVGAKV